MRRLDFSAPSPVGDGLTIGHDAALMADAIELDRDGKRFPIPRDLLRRGERKVTLSTLIKRREAIEAAKKIIEIHVETSDDRANRYAANALHPYDRAETADLMPGAVRLMRDIFGLSDDQVVELARSVS